MIATETRRVRPDDTRKLVLKVPVHCRPPVRPIGGISMSAAVQRAETVMASIQKNGLQELSELVSRLLGAITAVCPLQGSDSLVPVRRSANDLRGAAAILGAPLVGELADTVFKVAEHAQSGAEPYRSLVPLLSNAIERLSRAADDDDTQSCGNDITKLIARIQERLLGSSGSDS